MVTAIITVFVIGYLAIAFEYQLHINKAAAALLTGTICWSLYALNVTLLAPTPPAWFVEFCQAQRIDPTKLHYLVDGQLLHVTAEIAQILFFLMGAMTIVELVDAHEGFALITDRIQTKSVRKLLWITTWLSFFFSAVLDNLTTTIVMVSLMRKLVSEKELRRLLIGAIVVAANAGGAWTVIGDVTTTMLWIKNKVGTIEVMKVIFLPSVVCLLVPLIGMSYVIRGSLGERPTSHHSIDKNIAAWHQKLFLALGLLGLLFVPIFKTITHLPPFMGMMLSLSVLWFVSEITSKTMDEATRSSTGVLWVLKRIDMSSILFFLGILLAVGSLASIGILADFAAYLDATVGNRSIVAIIIGLVSAIVDNVPLVAAGIEMYEMPMNDPFWLLLAYCAGTGGSCLIIGSAAGVAAMGLENISFIWYLRKIGPWALLGYVAGIAVYFLQTSFFGLG